jgi:hypothetical protein
MTRLDEIKAEWNSSLGDVSDEDVEWLIEQAERIEQLEKALQDIAKREPAEHTATHAGFEKTYEADCFGCEEMIALAKTVLGLLEEKK